MSPVQDVHTVRSTESPEASASDRTGNVRQLASADLLRDSREVLIRHGEQVYRLRHTRAGKLILTK